MNSPLFFHTQYDNPAFSCVSILLLSSPGEERVLIPVSCDLSFKGPFLRTRLSSAGGSLAVASLRDRNLHPSPTGVSTNCIPRSCSRDIVRPGRVISRFEIASD